jgi:hypothetical protein
MRSLQALQSIQSLRQLLDAGEPFDQALERVGKSKLAEFVRSHEADPKGAVLTAQRLKQAGIPNDIIETYFLFPSGRPRTQMRFIPRTMKSFDPRTYLTLRSDAEKIRVSLDWWNKTITLDQELFLPVIRYQQGMGGSLYFNQNTTTKYCGTFYYFEPSSSYYLRSHKTLITPNKLTAIYHLWRLRPGSIIDLDSLADLRASIRHIVGTWLRWTGQRSTDPTPPELTESLRELGIQDRHPLSEAAAKYYNDTILLFVIAAIYFRQSIVQEGPEAAGYPDYANTNNPVAGWEQWIRDAYYGRLDFTWSDWMYATEDWFDLQICAAGQRDHYDVIVLTAMTGATRLVSEVYDVRNREVSFDNIYRST